MSINTANLSCKKLSIPQAEGRDASGRIWVREPYEIECQEEFARDARGDLIVVNRDRARELAKEVGWRFPTATEDMILSEGPEYSERSDFPLGLWQFTDTGLLVPQGISPDHTVTHYCNNNHRNYWPRIVTENGRRAGELLVPEGEGRIVSELSVFGPPSETADYAERIEGKKTHFYFDPKLKVIDVLRSMSRGLSRFYFTTDASHRHSRSGLRGCFRLVRGRVARYKVIGSARAHDEAVYA